jgi:indole-3-glycerol phosphate synthase
MRDFIDILAIAAQDTIDSDYYKSAKPKENKHISFKQAILDCKANPVVTEIKAASPSTGVIRKNFEPGLIAQEMQKGGATALSVLTEPNYFKGSLEALSQARDAVQLPIIMKDIVLHPTQIETASKIGANAVLLIQALFDRGYCAKSLEEMISSAHKGGLEVLLETHKQSEFDFAVKTNADLIGINNRNLATLSVNLKTIKNILAKTSSNGKIVVSESGIKTPSDLRFQRESGARAFLIGSSIMTSDNIEQKVKEFVNA